MKQTHKTKKRVELKISIKMSFVEQRDKRVLLGMPNVLFIHKATSHSTSEKDDKIK